jgi:DNA-binding CsgD family transcriptional regulator/PAS domain-containing protein
LVLRTDGNTRVIRNKAGGPESGFEAPEDFRCPNCGAWESHGGCADPRQCELALANLEDQYERELMSVLEPDDNQPMRLLMAGFEALDLLNIGLAVTTASGTLLLANRAGARLLEGRDGLELSPEGELHAMKGCGPGLSELIRRAARSRFPGAPGGKDAVVQVRRPSKRRPWTLLVRPVVHPPTTDESSAPAALVFIMDPELPVEAAEAELRQLYGLTSTEARLANLLMEGRTLNQCCEQLGFQRSTGRTHLQHLFEKVGVQRQSELVAVLLRSIGLVRTGMLERRDNPSPPKPAASGNEYLRMLISRVSGPGGSF